MLHSSSTERWSTLKPAKDGLSHQSFRSRRDEALNYIPITDEINALDAEITELMSKIPGRAPLDGDFDITAAIIPVPAAKEAVKIHVKLKELVAYIEFAKLNVDQPDTKPWEVDAQALRKALKRLVTDVFLVDIE